MSLFFDLPSGKNDLQIRHVQPVTLSGGRGCAVGHGTFGEIKLGIGPAWDDDGDWRHATEPKGELRFRHVAIKSICPFATAGRFSSRGRRPEETGPERIAAEAADEIRALRALGDGSHPNVVRLLGADVADDGNIVLLFPYFPLDLSHVITDRSVRNAPLSDAMAGALVRDLLSALDHCHSNGIVHGDVKPGNLLLGQDGLLVLADFGLVQTVGDGRPDPDFEPHALCTLYYRSPESLLGSTRPGPPADIFAAGLVAAELLLLAPLFRGSNSIDQLQRIYRLLGSPDDGRWPGAAETPDHGKLTFRSCAPLDLELAVPRLVGGGAGSLAQLVKGCLRLNPAQREDAKGCLRLCREGACPEDVAAELVPAYLREPEMVMSRASLNYERTTGGWVEGRMREWMDRAVEMIKLRDTKGGLGDAGGVPSVVGILRAIRVSNS
mmetsp:Transcript_736/g.1668  ORF Transcript_736/g.1668 Transcript_736/m.1668 type:complete len:438 (-) Transcript_736:40-1353(-)